MKTEERFQMEVIEEVLQWSADKIYKTFGPFLETVVNQQKERIQIRLKTIWRNRKWYAFRDTGEQFNNDEMLIYFNPKKIKIYSLSDLETIIDRVEKETLYSNPKHTRKIDR